MPNPATFISVLIFFIIMLFCLVGIFFAEVLPKLNLTSKQKFIVVMTTVITTGISPFIITLIVYPH